MLRCALVSSARRHPALQSAGALACVASAVLLAWPAGAHAQEDRQEEEPPPRPHPAKIGATTRERLARSVEGSMAQLRRDRPDLLPEQSGFGELDADAILKQGRDLRSAARTFSALAVERVGTRGQLSCAEIGRRFDAWLAEYATQPWQRDARWWLDRIEGGLGVVPEFPDATGSRSAEELELENLRALESLLAQRPFLRLRPDSVFSADYRLQLSAAIDRFAERRWNTEQPRAELDGQRWEALHAKVLERFRLSLEDLPNGERTDRTVAGRLNPGSWVQWVAALRGQAVAELDLGRSLLSGLLLLERFPAADPSATIDLDALRSELIRTVPKRSARRLPPTQLNFEVHPAEPAPQVSWSQRGGVVRLVHRPQIKPWSQARLGLESALIGELAGSLAHACDLRPDYEGFEWRLIPDPIGCEALALAMGFEALRRVEEPAPRHLVLAQALRARWADALYVLSWHGHLEERREILLEALARRRGQSPVEITSDVEGLHREPRQTLPASLAALWTESWAGAGPKQRTQFLERQWLQRLGPNEGR